ncbi:hypothetical protein D9M71_748250 [compost metagenome]
MTIKLRRKRIYSKDNNEYGNATVSHQRTRGHYDKVNLRATKIADCCSYNSFRKSRYFNDLPKYSA